MKKASGTVSGIYCKKYVCGSSKDNAKITSGSTPINTYMLRLAEVYLFMQKLYWEIILQQMMPMQWNTLTKCASSAGLGPQNSDYLRRYSS